MIPLVEAEVYGFKPFLNKEGMPFNVANSFYTQLAGYAANLFPFPLYHTDYISQTSLPLGVAMCPTSGPGMRMELLHSTPRPASSNLLWESPLSLSIYQFQYFEPP